MLATYAEFDPALAYAWLATDGILPTTENQHTVEEIDARRWGRAYTSFQTIFEEAAQLNADARDAPFLEIAGEVAVMIMMEFADCVRANAFEAWSFLYEHISEHGAADDIFSSIDMWSYTEWCVDGDLSTFTRARDRAVFVFDGSAVDALDRWIEASPAPEDELRIHELVPDRRIRMATWSALLSELSG